MLSLESSPDANERQTSCLYSFNKRTLEETMLNNKNSNIKVIPEYIKVFHNAKYVTEHTPLKYPHMYASYFSISSRRKINSFMRESTYLSPLFINRDVSSIEISLFLTHLFQHDKTYTPVNKGKKHRVLDAFKILVPKEYSSSNYLSFIRTICSNIFTNNHETIPFFYTVNHVSNCTYIYLFLCNRLYYPEKKNISFYAPSDGYYDTVAKRRCKSDNPNAVLIYKKGDKLKEDSVYFSTKLHYFQGSSSVLHSYLTRVKRIMFSCFFSSELAYKKKVVYLPRLAFDNCSPLIKAKLFEWNKNIENIEKQLDCFYDALIECNFLDTQDNYSKINQFIYYWRNKVLEFNGSFKVGNRYYKYNINLKKPFIEYAEYLKDSFVRAFEEDFKMVAKKFFSKDLEFLL